MKINKHWFVRRLPLAWQYQWRRDWIKAAYADDMVNAKRLGKTRERIVNDERFELQALDEEIDDKNTQELERQALRMQIPVPPRFNSDGELTADWYRGPLKGAVCLTSEGINKLRAAVRAERKARMEMRASWLPWLTGIMGTVGTITGLIAVMKK